MTKVFMAEDDSLLIHIYDKAFKANGYEMIFAMDGEQALAKLKEMEIKPDIIFLDIMMPRKNGFETIQEIKKDSKLKDIPVVFLTNMFEKADEEKGMGFGAVAYMIKSQHVPSEIVAKAKEILAKK